MGHIEIFEILTKTLIRFQGRVVLKRGKRDWILGRAILIEANIYEPNTTMNI